MPIPPTATAHRRPLATAVVAAGALLAVWFLPSANTSSDMASTGAVNSAHAAPGNGHSAHSGQSPDNSGTSVEAESQDGKQPRASGEADEDTGSTPYVLGGVGVGAAGLGLLAARAVRRDRGTART
ncbi:hypothetical protein [Streptomyces armeniacus]|uniref:hypothetical protein n=1 Tax=Streptomyces armeniacus TaxID=83291 RepID=UPI001AD7F735|nr:hypothetical protein [Streptomyces armeniacus]